MIRLPSRRPEFRRGLLGLVLLSQAACFVMEPIHEVPPDGGGDAGEVDCDPAAPLPDGVVAEGFSSNLVRLRQGGEESVYTSTAPELRFQIHHPVDKPVPIVVGSSSDQIARFERAWYCIPAHETSVSMRLLPGRLGEVTLTATMGNRPVGEATLQVVDPSAEPWLLDLSPKQGIVAKEGPFKLRATFDFPVQAGQVVSSSEHAFEVAALVSGEPSTEVVLEATYKGGVTLGTVPVSFSAGGGAERPIELRIQPARPLISELLLKPGGFIELYNPTQLPIDLSGLKLSFLGWDARIRDLHSLEGALPAYSYYLLRFGAEGGQEEGADGWAAFPSQLNHAALVALVNGASDLLDTVGLVKRRPNGASSLERRAWGTARAEDMAGEGPYVLSGNGWDTGSTDEDFVYRTSPEPQSRQSGPESLFPRELYEVPDPEVPDP